VTTSHAGRSGLVVSMPDCDARGPRIEPTLQTFSTFFVKSHCDSVIHSYGHGLHAYCSVYIDSASHLPCDDKMSISHVAEFQYKLWWLNVWHASRLVGQVCSRSY